MRRAAATTLLLLLLAPCAVAGGADLAKAKALARSKDLEERAHGVRLLIEADAPDSIQPLEDVIRVSSAEMGRIAKDLDALDVRYMEAGGFWASARESGSAELLRAAKRQLDAVQKDWNAVAGAMTANFSIAIAAGAGFRRLTSPGALERLEAGVRTESDPWTRQFYAVGVARPGGERAVPALLGLTRSQDPLVRATGARGLRPFVGEPGVFEQARLLAADKAWPVRLRALEAIARAPADVAIPFLLEAIRKEKGELALRIDALLASLTGQSFRDEPRAWETWWKDHERAVKDGTFEPDERHDAARGDQGTVSTFFRIPVESLNVLFTLDYSSSMEEEMERNDPHADEVRRELGLPTTRLGWAQAEAARAIRALPAEAKFNVLVYSDGVKRLSDKSQFATDSNKRLAVGWLVRQPTGWLTNYYDALRASFGDVHGRSGSGAWFADLPDTILFLSDGEPTRGRFQERVALATLVRQWNEVVGASVHTVGIGADHDAELLAALAESTGGTYVDLIAGKIGVASARPGVPALERRRSLERELADAASRLESSLPTERVAAVRDLRGLRGFRPDVLDTIVGRLADEEADVRTAATDVLASCGKDAVEPLRRVVAEPSACSELAVEAALATLERLGALAAPALPHVVAFLDEPANPHRLAAARVLGALGSLAASARPALERAVAAAQTPEEKAALGRALARLPKK